MQFVPRDELSTRFDDLDAKMFRMAQVGNALGAPLLTAVALVVGAHAVDCHGHCDPSAANLCTPPASALRRRFDPMASLSHCTALHCTALHCTALHCTALHCAERTSGLGSERSAALQLRLPLAVCAARGSRPVRCSRLGGCVAAVRVCLPSHPQRIGVECRPTAFVAQHSTARPDH